MAYWVIHNDETDDGELFNAEYFDTWIEAFVYSKVQRADRGRTAEIYETYECDRPECENVPEWGLQYCARCRNV